MTHCQQLVRDGTRDGQSRRASSPAAPSALLQGWAPGQESQAGTHWSLLWGHHAPPVPREHHQSGSLAQQSPTGQKVLEVAVLGLLEH